MEKKKNAHVPVCIFNLIEKANFKNVVSEIARIYPNERRNLFGKGYYQVFKQFKKFLRINKNIKVNTEENIHFFIEYNKDFDYLDHYHMKNYVF